MRELTSTGRFEIPGVGTAYTVAGIPGLNPRTLQGQTVILDGHVVQIRRVETVAIMDPTGTSFSVVVASVA